MSLTDEEILTKREMIAEILDEVSDQLWSSDYDLILQTAELVGIKIVWYDESSGLFFKKVKE
jgi:hypothetical protein